jgi:hypothetical protein
MRASVWRSGARDLVLASLNIHSRATIRFFCRNLRADFAFNQRAGSGTATD